MILTALIWIALAIGLFFNALGVVGILRFPDVYTRLHADTKATTFGSIFTSLAVVLYAFGEWLAAEQGHGGAPLSLILHTLVAVVVLAITNATGAHAIARAAYRRGHRPALAVVDKMENASP